MKKYLKLIIPVAFLLITTSAFAQVNQEFDNFQKQNQASFDSFLNDAQNQFNDFAGQINNAKQEQENIIKDAQEKTARQDEEFMNNYKAETPSTTTDPKQVYYELCNGDKYCKTYGDILHKSNVPLEKIVSLIKNTTNYKVALYKLKYMYRNGALGVLRIVEQSEIEKLSSFEQVKDYILDMPLIDYSLSFAVNRLEKYYQGTKEEKSFVKSFIKILEKTETCPVNLDIENYGLDNFCTLSEVNEMRNYPANLALELKTAI